MTYKSVKGTADILPSGLAGSSELYQAIEAISRNIFQRFNYREIRTPVIEERSLFVKAIGAETDIVTKEMFSFRDRGEREIVLRPEGTAPIVRAYLEANFHKQDAFQKFYYIGPMFRAERPQAGRMRQFHQIGAEAIGSMAPEIDAEIIVLMANLLDAMKIKGYKIRINNLGCKDDKAGLSKTLRGALAKEKSVLCDDCKKRLEINPLRVLDCKNESCRSVIRGAFKSVKFLCNKCDGHFKKVLGCLDSLGIKYELDPYIVRGLDYYTQTVFEVTHPELGSQDALGAGGRYDNLISDMGGPQLGAAGFALGVERILIVAAKQGATVYPDDKSVIYIAAMGQSAKEKAFELINSLRGIEWGKKASFDTDYEDKSLKAQMREADKLGAKFVLIIGDDEISKGEAVLRDMATKEQIAVKFSDIINALKGKLC
ncbi:MAG: histidine--tRNA ligase [Candidatus Omnitrophica bacterium]|nr:histidine--tRNA ligase [Candidatus Omnitrophota bacterium]